MNPVEEIEQIHCNVTAIEREINGLYHQRAILLHRLNFLRSPVISKLPYEILAQIFRHALDSLKPLKPNGTPFFPSFPFPRYARTLLNFGAVCSHWRQTAWSSPQLWTFISFWDRFSGVKDCAALTRIFCANSGNLPISLYIDHWIPESTKLVDESMHLILTENSGRLESLQLHNPSTYSNRVWPILCRYAQQDVKFSQLAEVVISWGGNYILEKGAIFHNSPLLRSLSLSASPGQRIMLDFPWSQLTKVNLFCVSPNFSIKILYHCANLIEFRNEMRGEIPGWARSMGDIENPIPPQDNRIFVQSNMQVMTWAVQDRHHEIDAVLVTRFRFPNIRHLYWNSPYSAFAYEATKDFVTEMRQLETLESVQGPRILRSILQEHVEPFYRLSSLRLGRIDNQDFSPFLHALTVQLGKETSLPNLRLLSVTGGDMPRQCYDIGILVAQSRRNGPVPPFDLGRELDLEADGMVAYDPTCLHWQTHSRLVYLYLYMFDSDYARTRSRLGYLLEEMVGEAKTSDCTGSHIKLDWRE